MQPEKTVFSKHALDRMLQRGIEKNTVLEILQNPDFVKTGFDGRKTAFKNLDKLWQVVFTEENDGRFPEHGEVQRLVEFALADAAVPEDAHGDEILLLHL